MPPSATPLREGTAVSADGRTAAEFRTYAATDADAVIAHYSATLGPPTRTEDGDGEQIRVWEGDGCTVQVHSPAADGTFEVDTAFTNPG